MRRVAILGDIGSGKSYFAKSFKYPVFDADLEVAKLYKHNVKIFKQLNKKIPKYITKFPIEKNQIINAILKDKTALKKIVKTIHPTIRKKLNTFLSKNKTKRLIILDIPLFLENKLNRKNDILVFIQAPKKKIKINLKRRKNYNLNLLNKFKKIQLDLEVKKKKSTFIIKNNFTKKDAENGIKLVLKKLNKKC